MRQAAPSISSLPNISIIAPALFEGSRSLIAHRARRRNRTGFMGTSGLERGSMALEKIRSPGPQTCGLVEPVKIIRARYRIGLIYMKDRWGLGLHIMEYTG